MSGIRTGECERVVEGEAWTTSNQRLSKSADCQRYIFLGWHGEGTYSGVALDRGSRVLPEAELICGRNVFTDNEGVKRCFPITRSLVL